MLIHFCLLPFCALIQAVVGLRLIDLVGPPYPNRGDDVRLTCQFDTEGAKLYSVKWYKDENEFFRYMPDNWPQTQVFPLAGVILNETLSGMNHVMLTDVLFHSSGSYRCEISTEAPSFETVFLNHNLTVLSYPQREPELVGALDVYSAGDLVSVNCSASPSHPAPHIIFYANDERVKEWLVERGPLVQQKDGTVSTSATIRFHAEPRHFRGPQEILELRCQVEAPPLPPSTVTRNLYLTPSAHHRLAQHTLRNQGAAPSSCSSLLAALLLLLIS